MEGFDAGVIIRVTLMAVTERKLLRGLPIGFGDVLAAPVRVKDQRFISIAAGFCFVNGIDHTGDLLMSHLVILPTRRSLVSPLWVQSHITNKTVFIVR